MISLGSSADPLERVNEIMTEAFNIIQASVNTLLEKDLERYGQ